MKNVLVILIVAFISLPAFAQRIALNQIFTQGKEYYAVLDTTGIVEKDDVSTLISEIKKKQSVKDVILVCCKDSNNAFIKSKLDGEKILLTGLFIKDNSLWRALNGGVYAITKQRAGSFPPNIGLKTIGDNPFGNGISMVFTSNTPEGLKNILAFEDSYKSFYAVIDNQVVESLNLNRRFDLDDSEEKVSEKIGLDKALEDMNYFFNTVQSVHPQLLKNLPANEYLKLKKTLADTLTILDKKKDLTAADLSVLLSEAAARFKDGHTGVSSSIKNSRTVKMPPFRIKFFNGKFYVGNTSKDASAYSGCEILEINQKKPDEFLAPALSTISAESDNFRKLIFINNQNNYLAIKNIFNLENFPVTLKNQDGIISEAQFTPITLLDFLNIQRETSNIGESYFEFLNNNETAYFQYNEFTVSNQQKALIDSLFNLIDTRNTKNLIIDLRYNGGGNSQMGDYILNYLTSNPYCMVSKEEVKLSKDLLGFGAYSEYKELEGMTISSQYELKKPENRGHKFLGKTILLTGAGTFSSACLFTAVIKDFNLGTIIGSETGGMRQAFGDILGFNTPNFKIPFRVSHKIFYAPVPKPGDESHGTIPDIELTEDLLKNYINSKDPVLDFTLNFIAKQTL